MDTTGGVLVDLTDIDLDTLWTLGDDDVLTAALKRVTAPAGDKDEEVSVSAFNSVI